MLLKKGCGALQNSAALARPHSAPYLQRRSRRADGEVDIRLAALRNCGDHAFCCRINVKRIFVRAWSDVLAIDEQLKVLNISLVIHFSLHEQSQPRLREHLHSDG